ncbi:bifunctional 2-polyprenyl-6-hydroxyphenol methylase/3-demethylubiquinol 3-O-methyltransferase UbiG [Nocardiopsis sp. MG754419]|uniref:class I SAM-dependent methyltransferase n=1 Tax=Nocardiopsis sp. MG754419 TaxID=2259865 RepID=UPI001BA84CDF|nr:class I SAM-dependent methyltransferase [Nocardiopsis sp. MG754419]MBR8741675.1 SAM-dependent methyltransferase [Nocardiopsis sp. MG754419]
MTHDDGTSPEDMGEDFWNERYRTKGRIWSGAPNRHLVAEVAGLAPGRALDVGSGEGADALWLAERGWAVTAVDISSVALDRAAAHARDRGSEVAERITWTRADVTAWAPPAPAFDLVTVQFMHLYPNPRARLFAALAGAVAPGGELLVVAHHPRDLETGVPRPPMPELFYEGDAVTAALTEGEWEVLVDEARAGEQTLDGTTHTVHDLVVRARRSG